MAASIQYLVETQPSINSHRGEHYRDFTGKSPNWYGVWGDKCPNCGISPVFEMRTVVHTPISSTRIIGMKPGGRF